MCNEVIFVYFFFRCFGYICSVVSLFRYANLNVSVECAVSYIAQCCVSSVHSLLMLMLFGNVLVMFHSIGDHMVEAYPTTGSVL